MRIWQAAWNTDGNLHLWGESREPAITHLASLKGNAEQSEGSTDTSGDQQAPTHPFAISVETIQADLEELEYEATSSGTISVTLPTLGGMPDRPPRFRSDLLDTNGTETARLGLWNVPAVGLDTLEAIAFLTSLPSELPQSLRLGDSVLFWREASKLLLDLLTRGRFLPGLIHSASQWRSLWHLLPTEDKDHERLSYLAEAMPPVCRAFVPYPGAKTIEPSALLESFLTQGADALIRAFLSRHDLLSAVADKELPPRFALSSVWLASLTQQDGLVQGPEYELLQFEERLKSWAGGLLAVGKKHQLTTVFRLIPPPEQSPSGEEKWIVEFLLQAASNASQELPAAQLWAGDIGFLQSSDYSAEELEQRLLRDLGDALHVFPQLHLALADTFPTHVALSTEEAYAFLRQSAKLLEQHGFVVELPSWWSQPEAAVGLELSVRGDDVDLSPAGGGFLAAQELLDFSWKVSLGDSELTLDSFRKLVEQQTPLVRVDNTWVELQPNRLRATLEFLEKQTENSKIRFVDALRLGLGVEHNEEILPVTGFHTSGWIKQLLETDTHQLPLLTEPEGFVGSLREYQREGLSWLALLGKVGIGGCLADDMGLGKTVQLLSLLLHERQLAKEQNDDSILGPTLLLVPMSIIANWEEEAARFAPSLTVYTHHGSGRESGRQFVEKVAATDLVISTYSLAHRDSELMASVPWRRIALDEAQNIKNLEAKQTKAVRRLAEQTSELPNREGPCQRLALTGTPLENHLEELWSIFDFLNPGFIGTLKDFRTRFVIPIERYRKKEAASGLNRLIQPFVLRRLKTDPKIVSDLPEKMEMEVFTGLSDEQAALYQSIVEQMLPQVEQASGIHRKGLVLSTITKLKQICNHPALFLKDKSSLPGRSGKVDRLEQILEVVLAEGDRALIFTQYAQMGHLLQPYLQERFEQEVLFLHGALPKRARDKVLQKFRDKNGPSIFLLSLKAGGFGLNLTEANQVIHFDQWWNPAVEEQATDRAYRIGQKRTVQVRKFVCKGTLEEKIHSMLSHKRELAKQVVGSTKNMVTQLSMDELRSLLQLRTPL